jgi:uncharacterized protein (TIGR03905 family)
MRSKVWYIPAAATAMQGIGALIKGMKIDEAIDRLDGITCGKRTTSCPDQLAKALKTIRDKEAQK